ncbi:hypothetical protein AcV7_001465 [Taiwanofungus camphoratus]|nr:hypothetical protein AcV7_001465 [Antrodia cinnamomea]
MSSSAVHLSPNVSRAAIAGYQPHRVDATVAVMGMGMGMWTVIVTVTMIAIAIADRAIPRRQGGLAAGLRSWANECENENENENECAGPHHDHASSKALRRLLFSLFLSYPILSYPVLSGRASTVVVPHSIVPGLWSEVAWAAARLRSLVRARSTLLAGGDREGCLEGRSAAQ